MNRSTELHTSPEGWVTSMPRRHATKLVFSALVSGLVGCERKPALTFGASCLELSESEKEEITQAYGAYAQKYGIVVPITVELKNLSEETEMLDDGRLIQTLETAQRGMIRIDPRATEKHTIVLHALSHANQREGYEPEEALFTLESPWSREKPDRIYGYQGFSVLVELPDGERTAFRLIEEGVSEVLAYEVQQGYIMRTYQYATLSTLVRKLIQRKKISLQALAQMMQNHELKKFIGLLFDVEIPSQEQMVEAMTWFLALANGVKLDLVLNRAFHHTKETV